MGSHLLHRWNQAGRGYSPSALPPFSLPLVSIASLFSAGGSEIQENEQEEEQALK